MSAIDQDSRPQEMPFDEPIEDPPDPEPADPDSSPEEVPTEDRIRSNPERNSAGLWLELMERANTRPSEG